MGGYASTHDLAQVAARLGCSTKTVRRRIADGHHHATHVARGVWVIRESDLQAYLDQPPRPARDIGPIAPAADYPTAPRPYRPRSGGAGDGRIDLRELAKTEPKNPNQVKGLGA